MSNPLDELALELELAATARPHDPARYAAVLEHAVQACKTDPAAAERFDLGDLYLDLATEYQTLKRYDDALASADARAGGGSARRLPRPPESADTRSEYVMHRGATGDPDVIAWPPARNQPCWCGSGIKYKKCCAAPVFVDRAAQK